MVPEAPLEKTVAGRVPEGEGWFVVNARDVPWWRSEEKGQEADFEGKQEFSQSSRLQAAVARPHPRP